MVQVVVEAHARRWRTRRVDRHHQLELQLLLPLRVRHQGAGPAEERVVGDLDRMGQVQFLRHRRATRQPGGAEGHDIVGAAELHVLEQLEPLQPGRLVRGLVAEAVGAYGHDLAARRQGATRRHGGIDGVARGRGDGAAGRLLPDGPVIPGVQAAQQAAVRPLVAAEAVHGAGQVREAAQVAAALQAAARDGWRELHRLRHVVGAMPAGEQHDAVHDGLQGRAAPDQARLPGRDHQPGSVHLHHKVRGRAGAIGSHATPAPCAAPASAPARRCWPGCARCRP